MIMNFIDNIELKKSGLMILNFIDTIEPIHELPLYENIQSIFRNGTTASLAPYVPISSPNAHIVWKNELPL